MADDIRHLKHTAKEIDETIDMILETYTRDEINVRFAEIEEKIAVLEKEIQEWTKS